MHCKGEKLSKAWSKLLRKNLIATDLKRSFPNWIVVVTRRHESWGAVTTLLYEEWLLVEINQIIQIADRVIDFLILSKGDSIKCGMKYTYITLPLARVLIFTPALRLSNKQIKNIKILKFNR